MDWAQERGPRVRLFGEIRGSVPRGLREPRAGQGTAFRTGLPHREAILVLGFVGWEGKEERGHEAGRHFHKEWEAGQRPEC